jgi:hypothetical protein
MTQPSRNPCDRTNASDPSLPPAQGGSRVLFLDDDDERAAAFLAVYPEAVWVRTAEQCLERLEEPWNEVYLDHDLGGEVFVDLSREESGMAVVRWLCLTSRAHLKATRFVVHSHNMNAAWLMVMQLQAVGFKARACPFGADVLQPTPIVEHGGWRRCAQQVLRWLGRLVTPQSAPPSRPTPEAQSTP